MEEWWEARGVGEEERRTILLFLATRQATPKNGKIRVESCAGL